jgi:hypothetical protein
MLASVLLVVFLEAVRRARVPGLVVYSPVFLAEERAVVLLKDLKKVLLNSSVPYSLAARLKAKELVALGSCSPDWVWAT